MFQGGVCGAGEEGGGGGAGESGPAAATVVRTESHLARFNTARALFEKMGQGEARPVAPRANATAPAVVKAPPAKAEPEVPRGVATRGGVGSVRRPLGDGGDSHLSPRGDSLSPASSRSTSPSPARPAANGHAHHEEGPRTGLASLGGLRRPGSASSRSLSASSTDSDPPQRRWPPARAADPPADQPDPARRWPPPARGTEPPRTNGEGVRRASRPEKPVKPESLEKRAPAGGHDAHQELLARHKNWFQSFAKNRSTTAAPGRPLSPSKGDARPASPTKSDGGGAPLSPAKEEPRCDDWRAALSSRPDLRSPRAGQESERATTPRGRDEAPEGTTTTTPPSSTTSTTSTSIITTTVTSSATNNNIITPITTAINNNNNNSTCLTTTTTATTTTITTTTSSSLTTSSLTTTTTTTTTTSGRAAAGGSGGANEQEAWTSVLQTRYGTRARPDLYSPRTRADGEGGGGGGGGGCGGGGVGGGGDWRKERAAILQGRSGSRHGEDEVVTKGFTRTHYPDAPLGPRFEDASTLQSHWAPPSRYGVAEGPSGDQGSHVAAPEKSLKEVNNVERFRISKENGKCEVEEAKKDEADLIVSESVVLKDAAKEKDAPPSPAAPAEPLAKEARVEESVERARRVGHTKEDSEVVNALLKESLLGPRREEGVEKVQKSPRGRHTQEETEERRRESSEESGGEERGVRGCRRLWEGRAEEREKRGVRQTTPPAHHRVPPTHTSPKAPHTPPQATNTPPQAPPTPPRAASPPPPPPSPPPAPVTPPREPSPPPAPPSPVAVTPPPIDTPPEAENAPDEPLPSAADISPPPTPPSPPLSGDVVVAGVVSVLKAETVYVSSSEDLSTLDDSRRDPPRTSPGADSSPEDKSKETGRQETLEEEEEDEEHPDEVEKVKRQLFPDLLPECAVRGDDLGAASPPPPPLVPCEGETVMPPPPLSPRTQSIAALDALIHGRPKEEELPCPSVPPPTHDPHATTHAPHASPLQEEEEIVYDHTVTSAQHKLQFCTSPVTVEGLAPPDNASTTSSSHASSDPEPLPPPIPPHAAPPIPAPACPSPSPSDPEVMTAEEAQRLLSAKENQSVLSDEEAQEVVLLLSPTDKTAPNLPHPQETAPPPVPPHYTKPGQGDEYDSSLTPHFDPSLTSPLSPEEEPSEHDSSEGSGVGSEAFQVTRVKEVLVEDGVHYLEDGHFWVEVPGIPEEEEDEEEDIIIPFHPPTRLTFSTQPVQVFSTYSVTEYDRKNDEVDPVAASAEYELEKRVEKMDVFPVEIIKGEGGLGLSIIGMGVGADAGVEKLGIFVKTITPGGATEKDTRIQVNDQIIEVDGKSLVGVTQVFAASVLKNTSGRVHFLIGREKDPENSEVAILIKQSLQADREREERRRALGGPDYDPHTGHGLYDTLSSPSEENSRSEDMPSQHHHHHHHYPSYMDGGGVVVGSAPTSPDHTSSPPPEVFDLEGDTSDTSPDNDIGMLKLKLKELLEMEKVVTENTQYTAQLMETQGKVAELDSKLQSKETEVATYQDMLEQSQGQFIVLEKKYTKAKKIIKEYQGRERDFLHREEYHITQLEDKDSHYNALVKALKDRVIQLEHELTKAQKSAGLPVQVPTDSSTQPAYWNLQQSAQNAAMSKPPRKPGLCTIDPDISDTDTSDPGTSEGDKANTVERKLPVKEELDEAVPPHELLDVSASRAKGELASRGGLANRHLPSLKKTTSMSSASSQDQSLDESSLDDDLPEALKQQQQQQQQQQQSFLQQHPAEHHHHHHHHHQEDHSSRRSAVMAADNPPLLQDTPLTHHPPTHAPASSPSSGAVPPTKVTHQPPPPSYSQATMGGVGGVAMGAHLPPHHHHPTPPPPYHPPPAQQFPQPPRQPLMPPHPLSQSTPRGSGVFEGAAPPHDSRPEIPYRHPPPVARVLPVNRAEISESSSLAAHLASRTPQQHSLAEQLKALLAESIGNGREVEGEGPSPRLDRDVSPSKRSPTSLMEDVRQAVMHADVSSHHLVSPGHHQVAPPSATSPQRSQSAFYTPASRESHREVPSGGSQSPKLGRASPGASVSPNPAGGVVLLSQRSLDSSSTPSHKGSTGVDASSGELSSGPASLGSGDEGSGASLGSQTSLTHPQPPPPTEHRSKRSHMWQTAPVVDWTKEQVSQWLVVQGLEGCVAKFQDMAITGPRLLNLDARDLKNLGLPTDDKNRIKRKVKELRLAVEKERKQIEKEKKGREKLQKKAEKLAEKAERKKK